MTITRFEGEFAFLSNFFPVKGTTVEHRFQAAKTRDRNWQQRIMAAPTPGQAKRLGRQCPMREDWDSIRINVMRDLLRWKFTRGTELASQLLATGDQLLVEGNNWHDQFWGVCAGDGENWLGRLLMQVRDELRSVRGIQAKELVIIDEVQLCEVDTEFGSV